MPDHKLTDQQIKKAVMGDTTQVITPIMVENYLREMVKRLDEHTTQFGQVAHEAAIASAEHTTAFAIASINAPLTDGKHPTVPMREAYATSQTTTELRNKLVCEAKMRFMQEAGRNLREAAECARSVSASVRGNL